MVHISAYCTLEGNLLERFLYMSAFHASESWHLLNFLILCSLFYFYHINEISSISVLHLLSHPHILAGICEIRRRYRNQVVLFSFFHLLGCPHLRQYECQSFGLKKLYVSVLHISQYSMSLSMSLFVFILPPRVFSCVHLILYHEEMLVS